MMLLSLSVFGETFISNRTKRPRNSCKHFDVNDAPCKMRNTKMKDFETSNEPFFTSCMSFKTSENV